MARYITIAVPSNVAAKARAVFASLGDGHQNMVVVSIGTNSGSVSSGGLRESSPVFAGKQAFIDAAVAGGETAQDAEEVWNALDLTEGVEIDPNVRIGQLVAEASQERSAVEWEPGVYQVDDIRLYEGTLRQNQIPNNPNNPNVAGWRIMWSPAQTEPPAWQQLFGGIGYRTGERVTHNGTTWRNDLVGAPNVFEPGTLNSGWVDENEGGGGLERWSNLGGSGPSGSYLDGDRVIHDRPQDGGNDWIFESTFSGNTSEPGRDGTFDRFWTPIEAV